MKCMKMPKLLNIIRVVPGHYSNINIGRNTRKGTRKARWVLKSFFSVKMPGRTVRSKPTQCVKLHLSLDGRWVQDSVQG